MTIAGLHHITAGALDAQRTIDFYMGVLGLRLVKKTVNFDDPSSYHLYFGDGHGSPGSVITFFEWPGVPKGRPGIGGTHHVALKVGSPQAQLKWKRRLTDLGLRVTGPFDRVYFTSIYFKDPDGLILEIATLGPGWTVDEPEAALGQRVIEPPQALVKGHRDEDAIRATTWPEPVPTITPDMSLGLGMHHITAIGSDIEATDAFYSGLLGMRRVKKTANFDDPGSAHWYWGDQAGRPGTLITYFERDPGKEVRAQIGTGQTHHFAFAVKDAEEQMEWRERLVEAGLRVSPVMNRVYFKSIYTADPDGHIVELATLGPGFGVDEPWEALGRALQLPPWLERHRFDIETELRPVTAPPWPPAPEKVR
jgi:glyoxalase family protein